MYKQVIILLLLAGVASGYFEISNDVPTIFSQSGEQQWRLWAGHDLANILFDDSTGILFDEENNSLVIGKFTPGEVDIAVTAVGYFAGSPNDNLAISYIGVGHSAFGFAAGRRSTATFQSVFGFGAGVFNTGLRNVTIGALAGANNDGDSNTAIGYDSFNAFNLGTPADITSVDVPNNKVVVSGGHGFGAIRFLNLIMTSTGTLPGGISATPVVWRILSPTEIGAVTDTITSEGTGTLTITPQIVYENSTALGYNAEPDASNQVMLGDTNVTEVKTTGSISAGGLTVDGIVVFSPTELTITAAGGITPTRSEHGITGDGGPIDITADPQIAAGTSGQILILEGRDDTNTVMIETGTGVHLHGRALMGNHDILTLRYDGVSSEWTEVARNFTESEKAWSFVSPAGSSGTFYVGGYYFFNSGNSTFVAPQTLGTANLSYAAHAFIVASDAPASDTVITITGTTINDEGVRNGSATAELTVLAAGAPNDYYETPEKWIGQMTFTFTSGDNTVNYNWGMCKYWDNNNNHFRVVGIEVTGTAGTGNDANPNVSLLHHKTTGWTYNAGSTPSPPAAVADMNTDHGTESQFSNSQPFAWKRSNLSEEIDGGHSEGTIIQWDTTANKAVEIAHILLRIRGN